MTAPRQQGRGVPAGRCGCGKLQYVTRKDARVAARRRHPGERMSEYLCGDYWHIGHTPNAVRHGVTRRRKD